MNIKETQSKIRSITYKKLQMAEYLKSHSKQTKTEVNLMIANDQDRQIAKDQLLTIKPQEIQPKNL